MQVQFNDYSKFFTSSIDEDDLSNSSEMVSYDDSNSALEVGFLNEESEDAKSFLRTSCVWTTSAFPSVINSIACFKTD